GRGGPRGGGGGGAPAPAARAPPTPVAMLAPVGIRIVYGAEFASATTTTRILVLAAIPQAVDYLLIHVLLGFRSARSVLAVQVPVALATVLGLAFALRLGELPAVAAVSGATYTASAAALYVACSRLLTRAGRPGAPPSADAARIPGPRRPAEATPALPAPDQEIRSAQERLPLQERQ
ncbi:hypothetical protein MXD60_18575, partial [Frankia sp. AgB32]|nr:hypothetical protein [Frankia sp. AgB32]